MAHSRFESFDDFGENDAKFLILGMTVPEVVKVPLGAGRCGGRYLSAPDGGASLFARVIRVTSYLIGLFELCHASPP